jgi:cell division protein FtsI/penicillin-binding protein 2
MRNTAGTALVLDVESNQILAAERPDLAAHILATPGSTLKPFFLLTALQADAMPQSERVYCRRSLRVAGRPMNCVHPTIAHALDAREALAYSCNTYFAELASRLYAQRGGEQVAEVTRARGLDQSSPLIPEAAQGSVREPQSIAQAQLLALGVEGVVTSPLSLAEAYRALAIEITRPDATPAAHIVAAALEDSVRYGMADSAAVAGVRIAGKTGTASATEGTATHAWFVGYAPADKPRILVVVFLPHGHGADAARHAGAIFAAWSGHPA